MRMIKTHPLLKAVSAVALFSFSFLGHAAAAPDIEVTGNNVLISHGDTTPSSTDFTDFGDRAVSASSYYHMFTIHNTGDADLVVPSIAVTGTNAADFILSGPSFPLTVAPSATASFHMNFDPAVVGTRTATLTVNSDDPDESAYSFDLKGEGIEPEVTLTGNGVVIPTPSYYPSPANHTDFGYPAVPGGSVVRTFTLSNSGVTDLKISAMQINYTMGTPMPFTIGGITLPAVVPPSSSTTFTVTYAPVTTGVLGVFSATVTIATNDYDEPFPAFAIKGYAANEINLQGNGISIADGDSVPSLADHTDFGVAVVSQEQVVSTFTIQNVGTGQLKINSLERISGNIGDFTISGITTPAIIAAGSSQTFDITFSTNGAGLRSAVIVINNDDVDESTYQFTVQGRGVVPGDLDAGYNPNANRAVHTTVEQPDGKVVVGGAFVTVGGVSHGRVFRTLADGTIDTSFNASITWPGATDAASVYVATLVVLPDGKILAAGNYTRTDNIVQNRLSRLNSDGSRDSSFTASASGGIVNSMVVQPDGKILLAGNFTSISGTTRTRLARLNSDGTLDTTFAPTANGNVLGLVLQPDGKLIIGGLFTTVNGTSKGRIARLNSDGTLDTGFTPTANGNVYSLALQPDGKTVIGGTFTTVNSTTRTRLARLNSDGTLDTGFTPTANSTVYGLTLQADGKILVSGDFSQLNSTATGYCGRLNSDGTLDSQFDVDANTHVFGSHLKADGRVIIGGEFTSVQSTARGRVAMLDNNTATESLSVTDALTRIEWLRGGASPEASRVTFELSTDGGSTWTGLGSGTRISGGWELSGLSLTAGKIRARAFTPCGKLGASAGLVETVLDF